MNLSLCVSRQLYLIAWVQACTLYLYICVSVKKITDCTWMSCVKPAQDKRKWKASCLSVENKASPQLSPTTLTVTATSIFASLPAAFRLLAGSKLVLSRWDSPLPPPGGVPRCHCRHTHSFNCMVSPWDGASLTNSINSKAFKLKP